MKKLITIITILLFQISMSQNKIELPFYELPVNADEYTAGTVAAKQVEALGFRFYHATDNLSEKDLQYKPSEDSRTTQETIKHVYDLSVIVLNACLNEANNKKDINYAFEDLRRETLYNLKKASEILRSTKDLSQHKIVFGSREIPFWNAINGPIADAIWHCGQIATSRRTSGNPINSKVNHFSGTVSE